MSDLIELVTTNGIAIAIITYFLYKDYKFNDTTVKVMTEIQKVLEALKTIHSMDDKEE